MKYSKIFQYAYLVFAALFIYDAVVKYITTNEIVYPSILLGALAIFMFFFRNRFSKKFESKDKSN
ncbi:hypothetical protein [Flavivirga jejuensis]|uniref:Uncharacterized protein n=1 Tax=Flavivirga jejuensis TaxID=870487 RepID=A0ABT8WV12_9FLAO|nr:hypothetical protein [Flavivirga jejuensis]MDO5977017.1 hypothetical protein [Flavivirga jejuensis]